VCNGFGNCIACTANEDCTFLSGTPLCETTTGACVECLDSSVCPADRARCSPDHTCVACAAHSDCASNACLPDGTCGDDTNVAYVAANGTNNATCAKATPCDTVARAMATMKPHVKLTGTISVPSGGAAGNAIPIDRAITFIADPGTVLRYVGPDFAFGIFGDTGVGGSGHELAIYDLTITSAPGISASGVSMLPGARVIVRRARFVGLTGAGVFGHDLDIRDSVFARNTAGVGVRSRFSIVNTIITESNGAGITFDIVPATGIDQRIESCTLSDNMTGIRCGPNNTDCTNVTLGRNNILGDAVNDGIYNFSLYAPGATLKGTESLTGTATFLSKADPLSPSYYRLAPGSAGIDKGDPSMPIPVDIDGDARPQGGGVDMGADELTP
jgi:hypothetical protein